MGKIEIGQTYRLHSYQNGYELARVVDVKGRFFKKYLCHIWGITKDGRHEWPNGNVSYYVNFVSSKDLNTPHLATPPIKKGKNREDE